MIFQKEFLNKTLLLKTFQIKILSNTFLRLKRNYIRKIKYEIKGSFGHVFWNLFWLRFLKLVSKNYFLFFNLKTSFKMVQRTHIFLLCLKIDENNSPYSLKIVLYFTLFLKIVFKQQWPNSAKKF